MGPPPVPSGITETDIINTAVARLKGKSMVVRTPVEFARAVRRIERD
jgi:hypothetical protein